MKKIDIVVAFCTGLLMAFFIAVGIINGSLLATAIGFFMVGIMYGIILGSKLERRAENAQRETPKQSLI